MQKMDFLEIPEDIPNDNKYNELSMSEKGFLIENIIYKIFTLNKDKVEGITIKNLQENLYFSKNAILRVLTKLLASRDIYCIDGRPKRYFKNGRISHHFLNSSIILENKIYDFKLFANYFGSIQIFIQEKSRDLFTTENYNGGIILDADCFDDFVEALLDKTDIIKKEIIKFKNELKRMID